MLAKCNLVVSNLSDAVSGNVDTPEVNFRTKPSMDSMILKYTTGDCDGEKKPKCRPWNYEDFLFRVHSFQKTSEWFAKPQSISPMECALKGWCNSGSNKLSCIVCSSELVHGKDDTTGFILSSKLTLAHSDTCGWRNNSCERSFLDLQNTQPKEVNQNILNKLLDSLQSLLKYTTTLRALGSHVNKEAEPLCLHYSIPHLDAKSNEKIFHLLQVSKIISVDGVKSDRLHAQSVHVPSIMDLERLVAAVKSVQNQSKRQRSDKNSRSDGDNYTFDSSLQHRNNQLTKGSLVDALQSHYIASITPSGEPTDYTNYEKLTTERVVEFINVLILFAIFGWTINITPVAASAVSTPAAATSGKNVNSNGKDGKQILTAHCALCNRHAPVLPYLHSLSQSSQAAGKNASYFDLSAQHKAYCSFIQLQHQQQQTAQFLETQTPAVNGFSGLHLDSVTHISTPEGVLPAATQRSMDVVDTVVDIVDVAAELATTTAPAATGGAAAVEEEVQVHFTAEEDDHEHVGGSFLITDIGTISSTNNDAQQDTIGNGFITAVDNANDPVTFTLEVVVVDVPSAALAPLATNSTTNNNKDDNLLLEYGWEIGLYAATQTKDFILKGTPAIAVEKSLAGQGRKRSVNEDLKDTIDSAEQVYKKIRTVLNSAN